MDELILKCLQAEASAEELEQVVAWMKSGPENFRYYEEVRDAWFAAGQLRKIPQTDIEKQYTLLRKRIRQDSASFPGVKGILYWPQWLKVAAVFVFAFLLGGTFAYKLFDVFNQTESQYEIEAPYGAKIAMNLADGTKVWLNAGSKITYFNSFNAGNRRVQLVGEGYFEVAKNADLPFVVEAGKVKVKAVGTAFNVKAYPDEDLLETTLVEGKVDVSKGNEHILLLPNQRITIADPDLLTRKMAYQLSKDINTAVYTSWIGKRWIFERESMIDFVKTLERRYDIHITVKDERLNAYKITGSIEQQTLGQLLKALQLTIPLNYTINDHEVTLTVNEKLKREYEALIKK
jgi:ferric-dicitrate binding protein FerR (iron transport regulator)